MMVNEGDLYSYYKTNVDLVTKNLFTLSELEDMIPFERDVYITLYNDSQTKK